MRTLQKAFITKATPTAGGQPGEFEAIVSAFGVLDSQGDIVDHGAFTRTLGEWAAAGRNIPVIWSHQWEDPDSFIGEYIAAEETEQGLKLRGLLDVEENPRAARVYDQMRRGRVVEFSIGGAIRDWELIEKADTGVEFHITDIELWEAGPTFKGANPATELTSVKSAGTPAIQINLGPDADPETLRQNLEQILSALGQPTEETGEGETPAHDEDTGKQGADTPGTDPDEESGTNKTRGAAGAAPQVRALLDLTTLN